MPTYTYSISDTFNNVVAADQLAYQIQKNPNIIQPIIARNITVGAPLISQFELFFDNALSPAEETELTTVVIPNHDGLGLRNDYILHKANGFSERYQNIYDALSASEAGSTVVLPCGVITLDDPVVLPPYVLVKGMYGFDTTEIHPTFNNSDVFTLMDFAKLQGVSIKYPESACCVYYSGAFFAHCKDIVMFGGTNTSKGLVMDGLGILTAREIFHSSGDANHVLEVNSGEIDIETFALLSGNVFAAVMANGGEMSMTAGKIGKLSAVSYGVIVDNAMVDLGSVDFKHADKSICYRHRKGRLRCRSGIVEGITNSIEVDPLAYPYDVEGYFRYEGAADVNKISAPVGWDTDIKTSLEIFPPN